MAKNPITVDKLMLLRFPYTRTRRGILWTTRWFMLRLYPPVLPRFTFWVR